MSTKYILLLALVGVAVYALRKQQPATGNSTATGLAALGAAIGGLFSSGPSSGPTVAGYTNGTAAGTVAWDGSINTNTTTYGPSLSDAFDSVDA